MNFLDSKPPYRFLDTTESLKDFCGHLKNTSYFTVDTEFKRERTFWPELCLLQIASEEEVVLIDPLSAHLDLEPLHEVLFSPHILKVVHSGYEDMEIFFHKTGALPGPIFDTQIAAQLCGFGDSVGYHTLVKSFCNIDLDKSQQRTDWMKRPLTLGQKIYARHDVFYLILIYKELLSRLEEKGRLKWAFEEMKNLFSPEMFQRKGEDVWGRMRALKVGAPGKKPESLMCAKKFALWREEEACRRDLPRSWILSDAEIILLADHAPKSSKDFLKIKPCSRYFGMKDVKVLLEIFEENSRISPGVLPIPKKILPFSDAEKALLEKLKILLVHQSKDLEISSTLIATRRDLEGFVREPQGGNKILQGWRQEVFGKYATELAEKSKNKK